VFLLEFTSYSDVTYAPTVTFSFASIAALNRVFGQRAVNAARRNKIPFKVSRIVSVCPNFVIWQNASPGALRAALLRCRFERHSLDAAHRGKIISKG